MIMCMECVERPGPGFYVLNIVHNLTASKRSEFCSKKGPLVETREREMPDQRRLAG